MSVSKQEVLAKCLGQFMHSINEVSNGTETIPAAIYRAMGEYACMNNHSTSMTKREELASRAMQGLLANYEAQIDMQGQQGYDGTNFAKIVATNSVAFADALLTELEK